MENLDLVGLYSMAGEVVLTASIVAIAANKTAFQKNRVSRFLSVVINALAMNTKKG